MQDLVASNGRRMQTMMLHCFPYSCDVMVEIRRSTAETSLTTVHVITEVFLANVNYYWLLKQPLFYFKSLHHTENIHIYVYFFCSILYPVIFF